MCVHIITLTSSRRCRKYTLLFEHVCLILYKQSTIFSILGLNVCLRNFIIIWQVNKDENVHGLFVVPSVLSSRINNTRRSEKASN